MEQWVREQAPVKELIVLHVAFKILRNEIHLVKTNMHLMLSGLPRSFSDCISLQSTLLHPLHLRRCLTCDMLYIISDFSEETNCARLSGSLHTAMIGQSEGCRRGLLISIPIPVCRGFSRWAVLYGWRLRKSLACQDQTFRHFPSLFGLRYRLQNMFFKLWVNHINPEYFTWDYL